MKKYFYSLFAAASMMLAVTSCSQEEELEQISSGQTTTFSVDLDGVVGSRAVGEGVSATKLYYEVHRIYSDGTTGIVEDETVDLTKTKNVPITLLNGEKYNTIFWAQAPTGSIYDVDDLTNIQVNYANNSELLANQEAYDAFYNALAGFKADGKTHTVTLRRPFAQLNLGANDWETAKSLLETGVKYPVNTTSVKVKGLASTFNALTGEASAELGEAITFALNKIPAGVFKVNSTDYKYLSANYLLIPGVKAPNGLGNYVAETECKATVDLEFVLKRGDNEILNLEVPNAPVQRNWRTNVIGALLTGGNSFDIVIDPNTDNDENINTPVVGLTALYAALEAYKEDAPVIYNVTGLGTLTDKNDAVIEIPEGFKAAKVTFNLKDIKCTNLIVKDKNTSDPSKAYDKTVAVSIPKDTNLESHNVVLPGAHVELLGGHYGNGTVSTSSSTLVLLDGATIGNLIVNSGNVEIQSGSVNTIEAGENNDDPIIVTLGNNVALPVIIEGTEVIIQGTDDAENEGVVYVAQVGDYKYTNLKDAVALITPKEGEEIAVGEIKMINNYSLDGTVTIPAGKDITLDLNGKTISQEKECTASYEMICNKGTLTIKDSSENGDGKISFKDTSAGDPTYGWGSYTVRNEGTLVVEGGIIEHLGEQEAHMICAIFQYSGSSTINGGTISTPKYRSARLWSGDMTINGGTFDGQLWLQAVNNTADLTINGGSFKPNGKDGSSVFVTNAEHDVKFAVTGGTFETKIGCSDATKLAGCITGGTFTADAKENTNESLFNNDYKLVESDGYWTLEAKDPVAKIGDVTYTTLQKAVNAVQDGETITLIADEIFTEKNYFDNGGWKDGLGYSGDKSFTIDLGGHTIKQNGALNDYLIWIKNVGAKENVITIKNGTLDAGTTAFCALCTANSHENQLTVNIENVTLKNNISNGSTVKIRAGSVLNVNAGTKIIGIDSYLGIENWNATVNICDGAEIYMNGTSSYNGCLVGVGGNGTINVYGGYGKGVSGGLIAMTSGGTINVSGGEWIANTDGTFANGNKSVLIAQSDKQYNAGAGNAVVNVTGGTFKGGYNCYGNAVGDAQINIKGGNFNADPSAYVVNGFKAVDNNGVWSIAIDPVAKIGSTEYATLQEAFNVGGEITLLRDVTIAETVVLAEGKNAVLDLNGKTLAAKDMNTIKNNGGNLTIKNGTVTRTGDVVGYSVNNASGEITVEDATIERGLYTSGSKMTANNANISHEQSSRHAIYAWNCEVTINSGTFHNNNAGNATLMASGSSVVTINGGTFSIADGRSSLGWTSSMIDQNSTAQVLVKGGLFNGGFRINSADTKLTIEGGEFNTNNGSAFTDYNGTKVVKGGKFTDAGAQNWAKKYIAEGYEMNANGEVVAK